MARSKRCSTGDAVLELLSRWASTSADINNDGWPDIYTTDMLPKTTAA